MCNIFFVDKCFVNLPKINPFDSKGLYDKNWVFLKLVDTDGYSLMTGSEVIFGLTISMKSNHWYYNFMDFIHYQNIYNRNIIIRADKSKYKEALERYHGHSINDRFTRPYEPDSLVHSTTYESYQKILQDGFIKSWNLLKKEKYICHEKPIGVCLCDPSDFSDFVMLGGGVSPEIVVSSKQKGYICMEQDCEYQPGARFYFDTNNLAENGLLIRDGAHFKVKDKLSIEHCELVVTKDDIPNKKIITPRYFAQFADDVYSKLKGS